MLVVMVKRKLKREVAIERIVRPVLREKEGGGSGDDEVKRGVVSPGGVISPGGVVSIVMGEMVFEERRVADIDACCG
jgi:hypothetical protein